MTCSGPDGRNQRGYRLGCEQTEARAARSSPLDGVSGSLLISRQERSNLPRYRGCDYPRPARLSLQAKAVGSLFRRWRHDGGNAFTTRELHLEHLQPAPRSLQAETKLDKDRKAFLTDLKAVDRERGVHLDVSELKAVLNALGERDETAEICRDRSGDPEPDAELRDTENVPLKESIAACFKREVLPHVPDAWIDESKTKGGYEIPLNRHFYRTNRRARWRRFRPTSGDWKAKSWRCSGRWRNDDHPGTD